MRPGQIKLWRLAFLRCTARAADDDSVRNTVMQALARVLVDQQRIHELV